MTCLQRTPLLTLYEAGEGYFKSPSCRQLDGHLGDLEMRIKVSEQMRQVRE